jgi:hypothetical protein
MRGIVARNWPYFLENLLPEGDDSVKHGHLARPLYRDGSRISGKVIENYRSICKAVVVGEGALRRPPG